ncbi:uncharacterized protein LOC123873006 isoform X2 [Maniola jurtina]|uniref:uncharacterized protein LOC123873006 isoform X1 n=1 Tax=Maniola jurtina TaxID=191418 RepID=UPI001E689AD1|nr:uncharacterized protein LOC123873006 isoform X1 [Maniola jurtina]XP_045773608.1 uncharacterized protein LOC123873006 isoform X2 [Maniola jurtina]
MCAKMLLYNFSLFSAIVTWIGVLAEEEVSSPLRVAQCRATCLQKFAAPRPGGESSCLQGPDCFMCWENCELLQSNYQVWGAVCDEKDICFPGCKVACEFHTDAARASQTQPVIHTKGEGVMRVSGALARWPPPASRPAPLVYVVMRRAAEGPWRQIIQTQALATRVPSNNEGALLRVLVVDPQGLVTIYSPDETWDAHDTNTSNHDEHRWILKEISLIHQKVLVIGEIAWEPRITRGVYLVTWEVDGGGLKGNLFTDSTRVTLSLWPDTIYHIQVELVSRTPGVDNEKSETMTIDTSRAQRVSTESVQDVEVSEGDRLMSVLVSSMRGERVSERAPDSELVLGCLSAMVAFGLAVLAAIVWRRRRRGTFPGTNVYVGSSSVLKRKLVEDFIPAPHCFQPVLAPETPTNGTASRDVVV